MSHTVVLKGDIPSDLDLSKNLQLWLRHFDADFYRNHTHLRNKADLKDLSEQELINHFLKRGYKEGRSYNRYFLSFLNPFFYIAKYPELNLSSPSEAVKHWMYHGVYDGKVPNEDTQKMVEARIHLFQMGKVASKSIEQSIRNCGYTQLVPHLHWQNELMITYSSCFFTYEEAIIRSEASDLNFVSGVREPIDRVLSGIFQASSDPKSTQSLDELTNKILEGPEALATYLNPSIELILNWFNHKFYCDLDIYSEAFDCQKGYQLIQNKRGLQQRRAFIYRTDKLLSLWDEISKFLELKLEPVSTNKSDEKEGAGKYLSGVKDAKLPSTYLDKIYSSKLCQHFYTAEEIASFKERWSA